MSVAIDTDGAELSKETYDADFEAEELDDEAMAGHSCTYTTMLCH